MATIGGHLIQLGSRDGVLAWERFIDFYGLPEGFDLVRQVQAVGPADIQRMAKKYLDPKRLTIVVVGDAKTVLPQLRVIARVVK
jgi:zinc protease